MADYGTRYNKQGTQQLLDREQVLHIYILLVHRLEVVKLLGEHCDLLREQGNLVVMRIQAVGVEIVEGQTGGSLVGCNEEEASAGVHKLVHESFRDRCCWRGDGPRLPEEKLEKDCFFATSAIEITLGAYCAIARLRRFLVEGFRALARLCLFLVEGSHVWDAGDPVLPLNFAGILAIDGSDAFSLGLMISAHDIVGAQREAIQSQCSVRCRRAGSKRLNIPDHAAGVGCD